MLAMVFDNPGKPLRRAEITAPQPGPRQLSIRVHACAVCRTDLHVVDGDCCSPKLPIVPGHEIVGTVAATWRRGRAISRIGHRVGVALARVAPAGLVEYLQARRGKSLRRCRSSPATLSTAVTPNIRSPTTVICFPIPGQLTPTRRSRAAPVRRPDRLPRLDKAGDGKTARHLWVRRRRAYRRPGRDVPAREIYAFTRPGDKAAQQFARSLGCAHGRAAPTKVPPHKLDAAIIFAPAGEFVPEALRASGRAASWFAAAST